MHGPDAVFEYEVFHACERGLLTGLAEKYHQDDPLHLLHVDVLDTERHKPIEHQFALLPVEYSDLLEIKDVAETLAVEARQLRGRENPG